MSIHVFKYTFAIAYLLMIISSIYLVRENQNLIDNVHIFRAVVIASSLSFWLISSRISRLKSLSVLLVSILLLPYVFTDAIISYIDIVFLVIIASTLGNDKEVSRFFIVLSYISLFLAMAIVVLSYFGYLPSKIFEWKQATKNGFGFTNPNTLFFYIFSSALTFFVFREKLGFLICGALIAILYPYVGSRTFAISYIIAFIAYFFLANRDGPALRALLWVWLSVVIVLGVSSAYFPLQVSEGFSKLLGVDSNELLSNRFVLLELINMGKTDMEFLFGGLKNESDSMYIYFLNSFGSVVSIFLLVIALVKIKISSQKNGAIILIISCIFFTIGLVEVPFDGSALIALLFVYLSLFNPGILAFWSEKNRSTQYRTAPSAAS